MFHKIYNMKLFESIEQFTEHSRYTITRVPGGWLFRCATLTETFVPFNNEFMNKQEM